MLQNMLVCLHHQLYDIMLGKLLLHHMNIVWPLATQGWVISITVSLPTPQGFGTVCILMSFPVAVAWHILKDRFFTSKICKDFLLSLFPFYNPLNISSKARPCCGLLPMTGASNVKKEKVI